MTLSFRLTVTGTFAGTFAGTHSEVEDPRSGVLDYDRKDRSSMSIRKMTAVAKFEMDTRQTLRSTCSDLRGRIETLNDRRRLLWLAQGQYPADCSSDSLVDPVQSMTRNTAHAPS